MEPRAKATTVESPEEGEVIGIEWLRHSAALHYVTSLDGISIRELHKRPPFDQVSETSLERWCAEDEWVRRRQKYMARIRSDIEAHIAEKMVETRIEQLKQIDAKVGKLFTEIDGVAPKSKEGLITATVRLLEAGDNLREKLSKEVVPEHLGGVQQETIPLTPQLDREDARAAAKAVLQRRRDATRARNQAERGADDKPEQAQPKLRVVRSEDG